MFELIKRGYEMIERRPETYDVIIKFRFDLGLNEPVQTEEPRGLRRAARVGPVGAGIGFVRAPKGIPRPHEQHAGLPRKLPHGRDTGDSRVPQISEGRARTEGSALSI